MPATNLFPSEFISFTVLGRPQPQGSTRAFMRKGAKFPTVTSDNKQMKPWRQEVGWMAKEAMRGKEILVRNVPVKIHVKFFLNKPAGTPKRVEHHLKKPDLDKLLRATCDALTGIVWTDDSQVCEALTEKLYGLPERTEIVIVLF